MSTQLHSLNDLRYSRQYGEYRFLRTVGLGSVFLVAERHGHVQTSRIINVEIVCHGRFPRAKISTQKSLR